MSANDPKRTLALSDTPLPLLARLLCFICTASEWPRGDNEAARVHHTYRQRGSDVPVRGARAAGDDACDWVHQRNVA